MRKSELALGTLLVALVCTASFFILQSTRRDQAIAANAEIYRQLDLFGEVLERVRAEYVEKPNDTKLIENAINGMLQGLDPHSSYLTPKDFQDMQVQTRGEFGGLGIEVTMEDGVVKVISPIDNTPADRAGVMSGDYITHLDGESIQGLSLNEAVEKMRGPVDSPIMLTIMRKGANAPIQTRVVRDIVRINPVKYSAEGDVGWIKVKTFQSEHTYEYMKQGIEDLKKTIGPKLKGFVLDLRNNPGGLLDQAIAVSDAFLDKGAIVLTKGRNASESSRASAKNGDLTDGKPVVILINGGSASASEIVAGALQDHKRAEVIGTRSFGKGSVQTMIPLGANGGLRLTTARYYTPSGRSIQATGISPNYLVEPELPDDLKQQMASFTPKGEASLRGHLKNEGAQEASGSISYVPKEKEKDVQLKAAIDYLHGKKIEVAKKVENAAAPAAAVAAQVPN
ncbi:S41 family peptidase [Rhodomicrobium sp. Az07]|uniref:S41 family peptidase n=1 Tax=Rhodomicrobium sp. Az07 TaxID=2839034 RepID=UPI001BE72919|nr:S41 family peptidase [Rhodomicrobium sp. Az07]MBT3070479.1 S41 family peptidase [Rhodomicrobium sp. Az07]